MRKRVWLVHGVRWIAGGKHHIAKAAQDKASPAAPQDPRSAVPALKRLYRTRNQEEKKPLGLPTPAAHFYRDFGSSKYEHSRCLPEFYMEWLSKLLRSN
jgi:hypothetical protein